MLRQNDRPAREAVSIGAFRLLPAQRLLMKHDQVIKLGSRSFDILLALAERPGEVVSQKELIARVWPDVVVGDASLRVHVAALRKALDCDGTRYLANVPGRGYSLVAPTSRAPIEETPKTDPAVEPAYPLPRPLAHMVGRDEDVRAMCERLLSTKFLTIVGPGGVGKTTAALSVAHALLNEFLGAVCFVELSPVGSPQFLAATVTSAFRLPVRAQDPIPDLVAHLRGKRVFLVLDGCEHLIAEAAAVAERLFQEASDLYILATSREALRIEGEHIHLLPPLLSPPEGRKLAAPDLLAYPAAQLFVNRITSAGFGDTLDDEDAQIVGKMCRQLGGIALAIEFAAGRVAAYGIRKTGSLLNSEFALLWPGRRTAPPRQQTLNATLEWSYALLSEGERTVLRRLAVFAGGGFTLEAARQVVGEALGEQQVTEAVGGLFAKSLVSAEMSDAVARYRLLDTTRAYAGKKLDEAAEREFMRARHARYYCELLRAAAADEIDDKNAASATDLEDVRAALQWTFDDGGDVLVGADIAAYSAPIWLGKALLSEGRTWMAKAAACIENSGASIQQQLRIQLAFASTELFTTGFTKETVRAWAKTIERAEIVGDLPAQLLCHLALWGGEVRATNYVDALGRAEKCAAISKLAGDAGSLAQGEWMLGHSKHCLARFEEARAHLERYFLIDTDAALLASTRATGFDRRVDAFGVLSSTLWILGQPDQAKALGEQGVAEARTSGFAIAIGFAMECAGLNAYLSGADLDVIEGDMVELLEHGQTHSIDSNSGWALSVMGLCQAKRGQFDAGARMVTEGLQVLANASLETFSTLARAHICEAAIVAGQLDDALFWSAELESKNRNPGHWCSAEVLRVRGLLARAQGDRAAAAKHFADAIALAREQRALSWELRATMDLSELWADQALNRQALEVLAAVYGQFEQDQSSADLLKARRLLDELKVPGNRPA
jgi:predicted ATPase/DNA-binding winged helix-turn-helix (wHTH) protein